MPERTVRNAAELCEVGPTLNLRRPYDHALAVDDSAEATGKRVCSALSLAPLLQIHVQPAPAFLMEANAPLPHQAAFATEDALFIACK
jgi:hypothetical protein